MNEFLKYCDDHSISPFQCSIMKIKIFIDLAFKSQTSDAGDIQTFLYDLEKQHFDSHLSANPMLVQAHQFFIKRQEIRMQNEARGAASKPECAVCKVTESTGKHYGSQYHTCDACRRFYRQCLLASGSPNQAKNCQGQCDIIGKINRKSCGSCRFERLHDLGMVIPGLEKLMSDRCAVCGDITNGKHYGVLTCHSCSIFYTKYGGNTTLSCKDDNNCEINIVNRAKCQFCRLQKCYDVGMNQ